ncbi:unnamed protein product [Amoebophrya sp. A25]|nr:unnamed protein product [Amoebophrya sp. A25]|eukprot:GSA25T00003700001.1
MATEPAHHQLAPATENKKVDAKKRNDVNAGARKLSQQTGVPVKFNIAVGTLGGDGGQAVVDCSAVLQNKQDEASKQQEQEHQLYDVYEARVLLNRLRSEAAFSLSGRRGLSKSVDIVSLEIDETAVLDKNLSSNIRQPCSQAVQQLIRVHLDYQECDTPYYANTRGRSDEEDRNLRAVIWELQREGGVGQSPEVNPTKVVDVTELLNLTKAEKEQERSKAASKTYLVATITVLKSEKKAKESPGQHQDQTAHPQPPRHQNMEIDLSAQVFLKSSLQRAQYYGRVDVMVGATICLGLAEEWGPPHEQPVSLRLCSDGMGEAYKKLQEEEAVSTSEDDLEEQRTSQKQEILQILEDACEVGSTCMTTDASGRVFCAIRSQLLQQGGRGTRIANLNMLASERTSANSSASASFSSGHEEPLILVPDQAFPYKGNNTERCVVIRVDAIVTTTSGRECACIIEFLIFITRSGELW